MTEISNSHLAFTQLYYAPVAAVWNALTDKNEMKKWYFDLSDFKAEVGFEFQFNGEGKQCEQYIHHCKIIELVHEKKLAYSWRYKGYSGNSIVTFELMSEGAFTKLKLTHAGLETFPSDNPDFARASFEEGWLHIISSSLKSYLEKA